MGVHIVSRDKKADAAQAAIEALPFEYRVQIAAGVLLTHAAREGDFGMRCDTDEGMFRITVTKLEEDN